MSTQVQVQKDIRVVVAIDFGTTYSGYAYAHKESPKNITAEADWEYSSFKTPTVIRYKDEKYETVQSWGFPALSIKPTKKKKKNQEPKPNPSPNPFELFKLYLSKEYNKIPVLPDGVNFKDVIKDYLKMLGDHLKEKLSSHWKNIDFFKNVLIVLTVPADFDSKAIGTLRECLVNAGLTKDKFSSNLKVTTEPEAAALYCLMNMKEEYELAPGDSFMVVDCGGGTVDLTTRKLLEEGGLSELTERTGGYCGSIFVDKAFLKFVGEIVGSSAIDSMKKNHYGQLQYMVLEFCKYIKIPFTGNNEDLIAEVDLEELSPDINQYVKGEERDSMVAKEWVIELNFENVKKMFDPVVNEIIGLIKGQLDKCKECKTIFMVGGFSESKYLQSRVREEFGKKVGNISVLPNPIIAVLKGGVLFGLEEKKVIKGRVLKRTYGTDIVRRWKQPDPLSQRLPNGLTVAFEKLGQRGTNIPQDFQVVKKFKPLSLSQQNISFDIYVTNEKEVKFCDEPGVNIIQSYNIKLNNENFEDTIIIFTLTFNSVEILATAEDQKTGRKYDYKLSYE